MQNYVHIKLSSSESGWQKNHHHTEKTITFRKLTYKLVTKLIGT